MARDEASENHSVKISENYLRLFGHEVDFDDYYTFLDYALCSDESNRVEGSFSQLVHLDARIATELTHLIEQERRGADHQKMCTETYASHVTAATKTLVGFVVFYMKVWLPEELYFAQG